MSSYMVSMFYAMMYALHGNAVFDLWSPKLDAHNITLTNTIWKDLLIGEVHENSFDINWLKYF